MKGFLKMKPRNPDGTRKTQIWKKDPGTLGNAGITQFLSCLSELAKKTIDNFYQKSKRLSDLCLDSGGTLAKQCSIEGSSLFLPVI